MYDVVALGESLIDFAPEGVNAAGVPLFIAAIRAGLWPICWL